MNMQFTADVAINDLNSTEGFTLPLNCTAKSCNVSNHLVKKHVNPIHTFIKWSI